MSHPNDDFMDTVPGALVQFVVDEMCKNDMARTAWQNLPDDARLARLEKMRDRAETIAQGIVNDVAADGLRKMECTIDKIQVTDKVQVVLRCSKGDPMRHELFDSAGQMVLLVIPQLALDLTTNAGRHQQEAMFDEHGVPPSFRGPTTGGPDGRH